MPAPDLIQQRQLLRDFRQATARGPVHCMERWFVVQ
jgi:hypothetical protein